MADQGELREALAATLGKIVNTPHPPYMNPFALADAVLALLADRGWVSGEEHEQMKARGAGVVLNQYLDLTSQLTTTTAEADEARAALHSIVEGLEQVPSFTIEGQPVYVASAAASAVLEAVKQ